MEEDGEEVQSKVRVGRFESSRWSVRVRTASGSDRIEHVLLNQREIEMRLMIRSLPLAVLTRFVLTLTLNYTWERQLMGRSGLS